MEVTLLLFQHQAILVTDTRLTPTELTHVTL